MSNERLFGDESMDGVTGVAASDGAGKPRVMEANRAQVQLRPYDLESLLAPDHLARSMWSIVEKLDLSRFYDAIAARGSEPGRSAIDPKILVCLWLYATSEGIGSARRVARLCEEHDAYRWICGSVSVNHHKLSDFRVGNEKAIDDLMTQVLGVMIKGKLVKFFRLAQDGMKVRANAGAASFRREKSLEACLEMARQQVERAKRDAEEDPQPSARQRAARERAAREREERVAKALAELPKAQAVKKREEKEKARVSTTDPEARVMKMGDGGFRPAYNVQLATDTESRVIVGVKVTNAGADGAQMEPMLDEVKQRTGELPKEHLVDGGFVNTGAIEKASAQGITVYAPVPKPKKEGVDPHAPKAGDAAAVAEWRQRMGTDDAKETYKQRAATAETVNADLRAWRGLDRLLVRGSGKVTSVVLWSTLTYNVMRWISLGALA